MATTTRSKLKKELKWWQILLVAVIFYVTAKFLGGMVNLYSQTISDALMIGVMIFFLLAVVNLFRTNKSGDSNS